MTDHRITELEAEVEQLREDMELARTYKGIEARACPLCRYENGVFIEACALHLALAAERAARERAEEALRDVLYDAVQEGFLSSEGRHAVERARAALATEVGTALLDELARLREGLTIVRTQLEISVAHDPGCLGLRSVGGGYGKARWANKAEWLIEQIDAALAGTRTEGS